MSSPQITPPQSPAAVERRSHRRRKIDRLSYVHLDQDNGGILIDLSETGLNFQGVAGVVEGEPCHISFILPMTSYRIETSAQVVWSNSSRKGGGVRFIDLPEPMRQQIQDWIASDSTTNGVVKHLNGQTSKEVASVDANVAQQELQGFRVGKEEPATDDPYSPAADPEPSVNHTESPSFDAIHESDLVASNLAAESTVEASNHQLAHSNAEFVAKQSGIPTKEVPLPQPRVNGEAGKELFATRPSISNIALDSAPGTSTTTEPFQAGHTPQSAPVSSSAENQRPMFMQGKTFSQATRRTEKGADQGHKPTVRVSRTGVLVLSACLIALLAMVGFSQAHHFAALFPSGASEIAATQQPLAASARGADFQVEVLDVNNHRWLLNNEQSATAPAIAIPPPRTAAVNAPPDPVRALPQAVVPRTSTKTNLTLSRPSSRNVRSASPDIEAPDLRVEASSGILNDSRTTFVPPPAPPTSATPSQDTVSRGPNFPRPILMHSVPPKYPLEAKMTNVGGVVRINATIGPDGIPSQLTVLSGDSKLTAAALAAVRQWRYSPALRDGTPVESQTIITVNFKIN